MMFVKINNNFKGYIGIRDVIAKTKEQVREECLKEYGESPKQLTDKKRKNRDYKMIVLLKLLKKNNDCVIYAYGYDEDNLDGIIEVSLNDLDKYKLIKESEDRHIGKRGDNF